MQKNSSDNNQNQRPKGYQDQKKTGLKRGRIKEIGLHGAQTRQANLECCPKRARRWREPATGLHSDPIQIGGQQRQPEREKNRARDSVEVLERYHRLCHVVTSRGPVPRAQSENKRPPLRMHARFGRRKRITGEWRLLAGE